MWELGLDSGPKKGLEWENWRNWTSLNSISSVGGSTVITMLGLCKILTVQEEGDQEGAPWAVLWNFSCKSKLISKKTFIREVNRAPTSILEVGR